MSYTTRRPRHFSRTNRVTNKVVRNIQSITMAAHTPRAPHSRYIPSITLKHTRNAIMEKTDTIMPGCFQIIGSRT